MDLKKLDSFGGIKSKIAPRTTVGDVAHQMEYHGTVARNAFDRYLLEDDGLTAQYILSGSVLEFNYYVDALRDLIMVIVAEKRGGVVESLLDCIKYYKRTRNLVTPAIETLDYLYTRNALIHEYDNSAQLQDGYKTFMLNYAEGLFALCDDVRKCCLELDIMNICVK